MLECEQSARVVLHRAQLDRELDVLHRVLQLRLDLVLGQVDVVEVLQAAERSAHWAQHQHKRLVALDLLLRLDPLGVHGEVPWAPVVLVDLRQVQCPAFAYAHFCCDVCNTRRRVHLRHVHCAVVVHRRRLPGLLGDLHALVDLAQDVLHVRVLPQCAQHLEVAHELVALLLQNLGGVRLGLEVCIALTYRFTYKSRRFCSSDQGSPRGP